MRATVIRKRPKIAMPPPPPVPAPAPAAAAPARAKSSRSILVALVVVIVLAVVAAGVFVAWRLKKRVVTGPSVAVTVRTSPTGATILVNGEPRGTSELQLELPPGTYQIEAQAEGYHSATTQADVRLGASPAFELTLQALPIAAHVHTDLDAGEVRMDGNSLGQLQDGQFSLESVEPGKHSLEVAGRRGSATIAFEAKPAASPAIIAPVTAKELKAVVVSSLGSRARVACSFGPIKAFLDGQSAGDLGPDGLELQNLSRGSHELVLGEGAEQRKIVIDVGAAPALSAFLSSDRNVGTLVVVTGEDNAQVLVDGQELRRKTQHGQLRIPNLDVKAYSVQVIRDGFQALPAQRAEVRKGEETRVEFRLVPLPRVAALAIRGAVPGAQVILDRNPLGAVDSNGAFSASNLTPGEHVIEFSKEGYRPKRLTKQFAAGETLQLSGGEIGLEAVQGVLHINRFPPDSEVTVTREGETQARTVGVTTLNLPEGSYTLKATAPNYSPRISVVHVTAGEAQTVDLRLTGERKAGMALWENPDRWVRDGNWFFRRGGGFALCSISPAAGRFLFTVTLRKGRRLQWVVNQTDERNYVLFQLEKKTFTRNVVRNGVATELARAALSFEPPGYYTLQVRVAAGTIAHQVFDGKKWILLDSWIEPSQNFPGGKFGFLIPSGDEVGVPNSPYYPQ
jgi:hypothetical protein